MKKATKNENVTKVICQNCGAEVVIPNHEHAVTGVAVGKDSGLGTIVLPTCGGGTDALVNLIKGNADTLKSVVDLVHKIEDSGYLDVNIVRRWLPSQCLHMLYNKEGFHKSLMRAGDTYSWKVLIRELQKQRDLYAAKDMGEYEDRNRWYNRRIAIEMADDYIALLRKHVDGLTERSCKGRKYKPLCVRWMNNGKGVFTNDLEKVFGKLERLRNAISLTTHPQSLYSAVCSFNTARRGIAFKSRIAPSFANAYKAAGAYYTMKDLIMFEGCVMKVDKAGNVDTARGIRESSRKFVDMKASLEALEHKANNERYIDCDGYVFLGLLKDFLEYNHFDFEATKRKWMEQSAVRKTLRGLRRSDRRPRN